MSESMRMQSQLTADLEVYRAKGELIALRAENATLQQLLEDVLHTFGYLRFHRVAGMDGLLYETHNKMSPERTVEACEKRIRAALAAKDAPQPAPNERVEYARLELAALFSTPGAPTLEQAKLVCENKNPADAQCILNAYEALREAAQDAGKEDTNGL